MGRVAQGVQRQETHNGNSASRAHRSRYTTDGRAGPRRPRDARRQVTVVDTRNRTARLSRFGRDGSERPPCREAQDKWHPGQCASSKCVVGDEDALSTASTWHQAPVHTAEADHTTLDAGPCGCFLLPSIDAGREGQPAISLVNNPPSSSQHNQQSAQQGSSALSAAHCRQRTATSLPSAQQARPPRTVGVQLRVWEEARAPGKRLPCARAMLGCAWVMGDGL